MGFICETVNSGPGIWRNLPFETGGGSYPYSAPVGGNYPQWAEGLCSSVEVGFFGQGQRVSPRCAGISESASQRGPVAIEWVRRGVLRG
jgi:hypothetical protein